MNIKVRDLMKKNVLTTARHQRVGHAKDLMMKHGIHAIPVVDTDGEPVGILTSSDVLGHVKNSTPVSVVMTKGVYTVPEYSDVHIAARVMRNQKTHHVVVTHEKKVVGMVSSFDLLRLVEDHRFTMKNAPTETKRAGPRGKKSSTRESATS